MNPAKTATAGKRSRMPSRSNHRNQRSIVMVRPAQWTPQNARATRPASRSRSPLSCANSTARSSSPCSSHHAAARRATAVASPGQAQFELLPEQGVQQRMVPVRRTVLEPLDQQVGTLQGRGAGPGISRSPARRRTAAPTGRPGRPTGGASPGPRQPRARAAPDGGSRRRAMGLAADAIGGIRAAPRPPRQQRQVDRDRPALRPATSSSAAALGSAAPMAPAISMVWSTSKARSLAVTLVHRPLAARRAIGRAGAVRPATTSRSDSGSRSASHDRPSRLPRPVTVWRSSSIRMTGRSTSHNASVRRWNVGSPRSDPRPPRRSSSAGSTAPARSRLTMRSDSRTAGSSSRASRRTYATSPSRSAHCCSRVVFPYPAGATIEITEPGRGTSRRSSNVRRMTTVLRARGSWCLEVHRAIPSWDRAVASVVRLPPGPCSERRVPLRPGQEHGGLVMAAIAACHAAAFQSPRTMTARRRLAYRGSPLDRRQAHRHPRSTG